MIYDVGKVHVLYSFYPTPHFFFLERLSAPSDHRCWHFYISTEQYFRIDWFLLWKSNSRQIWIGRIMTFKIWTVYLYWGEVFIEFSLHVVKEVSLSFLRSCIVVSDFNCMNVCLIYIFHPYFIIFHRSRHWKYLSFRHAEDWRGRTDQN